ncbi:MAG TPA: hypothetical protein PLE99_09765 [Candidatus Thiothrix moscowensis]|uniref:hypothetical protein n=1 Tax=Thiothrix sp. UBA2016 TaxID=1947695 RepID=UPI0025EBFEDB|nr:hypothetical protein [Thiothrix sp. UBA2016]HRJ53045.1 hypothetical protein [Candidatus Thiothrix moscowensis]HRJ93036.1 hypothetical protein [Candidatus Thiothrix moscowensis]
MKRRYYYPIGKLKPLKGTCDDFHQEVRKLQYPYLPISAASYRRLLDASADYYLMPGKKGKVVTFGNTGGGFALMPLNQEEASWILAGQPQPDGTAQ